MSEFHICAWVRGVTIVALECDAKPITPGLSGLDFDFLVKARVTGEMQQAADLLPLLSVNGTGLAGVPMADQEVTQAPPPAPVDIATRRAAMRCSPATMRLVLRWAGEGMGVDLRGSVETIAASDPDALDVWEYGIEFYRTSALIDAMAAGSPLFTPERIDALFNAAMAYEAGAMTKEQIQAAFAA